MKNAILLFACAALGLGSCQETAPVIDFGTGPKATDTSYMAGVEGPQLRKVVMEEFTGVSCPPCPAGHKVLATIEQKYPTQVIIMGIQPIGPPQSRPLDSTSSTHLGVGTRHDNRTQKGTDISVWLGGISSIPIAGIDRTVGSSSSMLYDRGNWVSVVDNRVAVAPAANVTITKSYDAATRKATIKVHVAYTQSVAKNQLLSVAIIENDVIDAQEGDGPSGYNKDYSHQHVLRDVLTNAVGSPILADKATKLPGLVYERTFIYTVDAAWDADKCKVVAYVSNDAGADREVVQGAEADLK